METTIQHHLIDHNRLMILLVTYMAVNVITTLTIMLPARRLVEKRDRLQRVLLAVAINWTAVLLLAIVFLVVK